MEAFDPIVIKVKGDAGDVLTVLAALKKAVRDFESTSKVTGDRVTDDFRREGKASDEFGRLVTANMRDGKTALESLRLKSNDLRGEIARLRDEFRRTGNQGTFANLQQAEGDFKKITGYVKSMEHDAAALTPNMRQFTRAGGDSLSIFEELGGTMSGFGPAIALGVAALAPLLGGLAGGTVLSVLAGGGLAAGISAQLGSDQVERAFGQFTQEAFTAWQNATSEFGPETAQALSTLGQYLAPVLTNLGQAFSHVAPYLDQIANAVGGALQDFSINLSDDFDKMGPVFLALEQALPVVIQGIGDFFDEIAAHAPEVADDIVTIAHGFQTLADVGGKAIGLLSAEMAGIHADYQLLTGDFSGLAATILNATGGPTPVTRFGAINQVEKQLSDTTGDLADGYAHLADEMHRAFTEAMSLDQSEIAMHASLLDLKDALKQNKDAWNINTRAGEADRQALLQAIQSTEEYYTNLGKVNGITPQLAAAYQKQIDKLLALAAQAGLSKDQVAKLKTQFDNLITVMGKANGKTITIPVQVQYHVPALPSTAQIIARRGHHAQSGVYSPTAREPEHFDRSGVYAGRPGGYYMGEASTGDEALIGRASNPERALAALATAAGWHDMAITPSRGGAFSGTQAGYGGGPGGGMVMADVHLDADKVGYAMIKWSGRFASRSGVTIAGAVPGTTVGQAR